MKSSVVAVMVLVILLLSSAVVTAETVYIVKSGDYLSTIGPQVGIHWKKIASYNNIKPPYTIYVGQKLTIPGGTVPVKRQEPQQRRWTRVGGNPYRGTSRWAINNFSLSSEVKKVVLENLANKKFEWVDIYTQQTWSQMTFGRNEVANNILADWDGGVRHASRDYGIGTPFQVVHILKCSNWAWRPRKVAKKPVVVAQKPKSAIKPEPQPTTPPPAPRFKSPDTITGKVEETPCWNVYTGAGIYESVHSDHAGGYVWTKGRFRPVKFKINDELKACFGAFAFGGAGEGDDGDYHYDWRKFVAGPSLKVVSKNHWDADIDVGVGKLWNKGKEGLYQSKQTDKIITPAVHVSQYNRRKDDKLWWPKREFDASATIPYDAEHSHSWDGGQLDPDSYDDTAWEVFVKQAIYDFNLKNGARITPGFNLGFIHENGHDDHDYIQFGPEATMAWNDQDIVSVSVFNYKANLTDSLRDQYHPISGWISLSGLYKAFKASQIKEATAADLNQ